MRVYHVAVQTDKTTEQGRLLATGRITGRITFSIKALQRLPSTCIHRDTYIVEASEGKKSSSKLSLILKHNSSRHGRGKERHATTRAIPFITSWKVLHIAMMICWKPYKTSPHPKQVWVRPCLGCVTHGTLTTCTVHRTRLHRCWQREGETYRLPRAISLQWTSSFCEWVN